MLKKVAVESEKKCLLTLFTREQFILISYYLIYLTPMCVEDFTYKRLCIMQCRAAVMELSHAVS